MASKIFFYVNPGIVLLDLAGFAQVFYECSAFGFDYDLKFIGTSEQVTTSAGLGLNAIDHFNMYQPTENDIVIISGSSSKDDPVLHNQAFFDWLNTANQRQTTICAICSGVFLSARAGLLNSKNCTTHWKYTECLQEHFPELKVQENRLFVKDGNIYTSAGIVSSIDLALSLVEERHGNRLSIKVARELVVYSKRNGEEQQSSVYLEHSNHNEDRIYLVQDYILKNLDKKISLGKLADYASCTTRNLTRVFKAKTGITITQFITNLRVERANQLLTKTDFKFKHVARLCGLSDKQLRNILLQSQRKLENGSAGANTTVI